MRFFSTVLALVVLLTAGAVSAFVVPSPRAPKAYTRNVLYALTREELLQREIDAALAEREARRLQLEQDIQRFKQEFEAATRSLETVDAQLSQEAQSYEAQRNALKQKLQQETASFQSRFEREKKSLESVDSNIIKKLERLEKIKAASSSGGGGASASSGLLEGAPLAPFAVISAAAAGLAVRQRQQQIQEEKLEQERRRSRAVSDASQPLLGNAATTLAAGIVGIGVLVATFTTISDTASIPFVQKNNDREIVVVDQSEKAKKQSEPMPTTTITEKAPVVTESSKVKETKQQAEEEKVSPTPAADVEEAPTQTVAEEDTAPVAKLAETETRKAEESSSIEPEKPIQAATEKIETKQQKEEEPVTAKSEATLNVVATEEEKPFADKTADSSTTVSEEVLKQQEEATIVQESSSPSPEVAVAEKPQKKEQPSAKPVETPTEITAEKKETSEVPEDIVVPEVSNEKVSTPKSTARVEVPKKSDLPNDATNVPAAVSSGDNTATSALDSMNLPELPDFNKAFEGVQLPDTSNIQSALSEMLEELPNNTPALVTIGATITAAIVAVMLNIFKGDLEETSSEKNLNSRPPDARKHVEPESITPGGDTRASPTGTMDRGETSERERKGTSSTDSTFPGAVGNRKRKPSSVDTENVARAFAKLANMQENRSRVPRENSMGSAAGAATAGGTTDKRPKSPPGAPRHNSSSKSGTVDQLGVPNSQSGDKHGSAYPQTPERKWTSDSPSRRTRSETSVGSDSKIFPNHSVSSRTGTSGIPKKAVKSKTALPKAPKASDRPIAKPTASSSSTGTMPPVKKQDSATPSPSKDVIRWEPPAASKPGVPKATDNQITTQNTSPPTDPSASEGGSRTKEPSSAPKNVDTQFVKPVVSSGTGTLTPLEKRYASKEASNKKQPSKPVAVKPQSQSSGTADKPVAKQDAAGTTNPDAIGDGSGTKESKKSSTREPSSRPKTVDAPFIKPVVSSGSGTLTPLEKRYASMEASSNKQPTKPDRSTGTPLEKRSAAKLASGKNRFNKSSKKTNNNVEEKKPSTMMPPEKTDASKDASNDSRPKKSVDNLSSVPKDNGKAATEEGPPRPVRTLTPLEKKYAAKSERSVPTNPAQRKQEDVPETRQQASGSDGPNATSPPIRKQWTSNDPPARGSRKSRPIITVEPLNKTFNRPEEGPISKPESPTTSEKQPSKPPTSNDENDRKNSEKARLGVSSPPITSSDWRSSTTTQQGPATGEGKTGSSPSEQVPNQTDWTSSVPKTQSAGPSSFGQPPSVPKWTISAPKKQSPGDAETATGSPSFGKPSSTSPWKSSLPEKPSPDFGTSTIGSDSFGKPGAPSWKNQISKKQSSEKEKSTSGSSPFEPFNPNSLSSSPPASKQPGEASTAGTSDSSFMKKEESASDGSPPASNPFGTFSLDSLSSGSNNTPPSKAVKRGTTGPPPWMSSSPPKKQEPQTGSKKSTGPNPFGGFNLDALSRNADDGSLDKQSGEVDNDKQPSETTGKAPGLNPFGTFNLDALSNRINGGDSGSEDIEDKKLGPANGESANGGSEEEPFS